ncbi:MAG TPA: cupin domain-containing protein [Candidatus Dormibacteraeota bacterium]|nr:cupin domain-containing protein [Candidatus Dormibacteraeota bacterium]
MIGTASLAAVGTAMMSASSARPQQPSYQTGKNPGKHEPLEDFKYDLENSKGWEGEGGSAKEVTVEEFPVSKSIAGVSMRLKPRAIRELHWHAIAAEWAFVITGTVRTTVINPNDQNSAATDDFEPGDIWYFPKGFGHSIQNIGHDDAHFLLGFDDGHFSEFGTFSITDWVAHTPLNVAERNLNLSADVISTLPKKEAYILPGKIPPSSPQPYRTSAMQPSQSAHKYRLGEQRAVEFPGGRNRIVTVKEFPINDTLTSVLQEINPGAIRELHWHPNADEWQFYLNGRSRVTIFGAHGRARTEEFGPGQVCFIQQGFGHYVEQLGSEPTKLVVLFNSPIYEEISISKWLSANPASLIADNFGISNAEVARMPKKVLGFIK